MANDEFRTINDDPRGENVASAVHASPAASREESSPAWRPRPRQPAGPLAVWITIAVLVWSATIALGPLLFSSLPWIKAAQAGFLVLILAGGFLGAWWLLMLNRQRILNRREAAWRAEKEAMEAENSAEQ